jgi:Domain of unknown function (DUF4815)
MPIETDLSTAPYHDDFDATKNFHRILFKPSVAVQVRELNQLQTILQQQVERFGNNIFKRGTIIDGCNFIFYSQYPYAKLLDAQIDGAPAAPASYIGSFVKNSANLTAFVINAEDGFESTDPDLKTIYLKYINSGASGNSSSFVAGQALTVYGANVDVRNVTINNGGTQFANSDTVVFLSAMSVNTTSGSWSVGNIITQVNDTYTAYAEILEVNTSIIPGTTVLKVKPRESDLVNSSINALAWTFLANGSIANSSSLGDIINIYGSGATAEIVTNGSGKITTVAVTSGGREYIIDPHVTIKSTETRASLGAMSLSAQTYICQVRVASTVNAVGKGYAFGITEGIIFQKGNFIRVEPQTIIVDKYSTQPNNLSVAFETREEIIDSNIDTSLLDNVIGTENETAPGADRLKLTPELVVLTSSEITGNDDVFPVVQWSEGAPYKQNQKTSYDVIGDEMAEHIKDASGDYVKDRFLVTSRSVVNSTFDANQVSIIIDPGTAYVSGYRTQTLRNFSIDIDKGIDTEIRSNNYISLNYGNYVKVNELAGVFQFNTGDTVDLYYSATGGTQYISNTAKIVAGTITPSGSKIGTARMRSLVLDEGIPGTNTAIYNLYLFDIQMEPGRNFANTRSIYYNGTSYKGIADVILEYDASTTANVAKLTGITNDKLLFFCGHSSPKNANQITYSYRTINQAAEITNQGNVVITLAATEEFFPYTAALSDAQEADIIVIPIANNLIGSNKFTGTLSVGTTTPNVVGTSTTFLSDLVAGDYVYMSGNSTQTDIKRVERVVNNTLIILDSNGGFTNSAANGYICFPKYVPIPINERSGYTANVDATGKNLRVYLGKNFTAGGNSTVAVAYNVERRDATQTPKTVKRDVFVKLQCNTHSESTAGPWCLGIADVIRLKKVYVASTTSVNVDSTDITENFFVDHNQSTNYYGLGYLYKDPYADLTLASDSVLLAQVDVLETSGSGFYTIASYVSTNANTLWTNDANTLANATTFINTMEIPEVFDSKGKSYDLIDYFDFRPAAANTANLALTTSGATINPAETVSFGDTTNPANNKKFPVPDAILKSDVEVWLGRTDSVFLNKDGQIFVERGLPGTTRAPTIPSDTMLLNNVIIPAYPGLPKYLSNNMTTILDRKIANERYSYKRINDKQIVTNVGTYTLSRYQPMGYTMSDIGKLERRIESLEYYTNLSLLEASIKDKAIPSNLSPNIDRFKFGFFIDDYSTLNYSDIDNPEYAADVEDDRVIPEQEVTVIEFPIELPEWDHFLCVQQKQATSLVPVSPPTATANSSVYAKQQDKHKKGKESDPIKEPPVVVTMSTIAGTATLWLHMMDGADIVRVYQGNTLIATGDDAQQISNDEKRELLRDSFFQTNSGGPGGINDELDNGADSGAVGAGTDKVRKAAKIVFSHSPSGGREYTIQIYKTSKVWRFRLDYPIDDTAAQVPTPPSATNKKPQYGGALSSMEQLKPKKLSKILEEVENENTTFKLKNGNNNNNNNNDKDKETLKDKVVTKLAEVTGPQKLKFDLVGLKPLTQHFLYIRGADDTASCEQQNPVDGGLPAKGTLKSDAYGQLSIKYYYTPSSGAKTAKNNYSTDEEEMQDLGITVINIDNSSGTSFTVKRKNKEDEEELIEAAKSKNKKKK